MSTNDVPGYKASHNDVLAMGCWAESADGSLILVEGVENGRVIYSMFDASKDPVLEYRDAMPEVDFKAAYSWQADRSKLKDKKASGVPTDIKWTWHDKTPFPWDRVIKKGARDGVRFASAADQLAQARAVQDSIDGAAGSGPTKSDAERVADSLQLRGEKFRDERAGHLTEKTVHRVAGIMRRLADRLEGLDNKGA